MQEAKDAAEVMMCADVARLAGVTTETVRSWHKAGKLPSLRTDGGVRVFRRADVLAFLREREEAGR